MRSECGGGNFFLGGAELEGRLLTNGKYRAKILKTFVSANVTEMVRKGERWQKGHQSRATWWRYLL